MSHLIPYCLSRNHRNTTLFSYEVTSKKQLNSLLLRSLRLRVKDPWRHRITALKQDDLSTVSNTHSKVGHGYSCQDCHSIVFI